MRIRLLAGCDFSMIFRGGGGTRAFLFFTLCCEFGMVDADVVRPLRQHDGCHGQQVVSPAFGMRTTLHNERRERDERMRKNNKFKFASVRRPFPPISPHPSFLPANFANSHVCIAADRRSTIIHHQLEQGIDIVHHPPFITHHHDHGVTPPETIPCICSCCSYRCRWQ